MDSQNLSIVKWSSVALLGCVSTDFREGRSRSGVYGIVNLVTRDMYIGSSKNLAQRWSGHRCDLNKGLHHSHHLQGAWFKYTPDDFQFVIFAFCGKEKIRVVEQFYVDTLKPVYNVIKNVNQGPNPGRRRGERHGWPMGKKHTLETLAKLRGPRPSVAGANNPMFGIRLTGVKNPSWGKKRPSTILFNQLTKSRQVSQFSLDGVFISSYQSTREAARALGITHNTNIASCARGEQRKAYGYVWKYADES